MIQTPTSGGIDETGNPVRSWADAFSLHANVRETLGKEKIEAGRIEDQRTATIRVRRSARSAQVTNAHRMRMRGQSWNIVSVVPVADGRSWIDILVELDG